MAMKCLDPEAHGRWQIPWLLEQLKKGNDRCPYTEATLSSLATNLLREMRNSPKVSQKFLQLGGVDAFQLVLCGDEQAVVQLPTPFHPELQVVLCLILAEVVLLGDAEVAKKRGQRKMAMSFFTSKAEKNSRMGLLAKMTRHNAKSEQAVELLFKALDGATRRHEHALVWGVLSALAELVTSSSCCQQLFSSGFIPLLHRVLEVYSAHPQPLPGALPRLDDRSREVTQEAPPFISTLKPSAIQKNPETLKQWWLKKSTSLPTLPVHRRDGDSRRSSLAWLSVSRSSKEGSDCRRILEMAQASNKKEEWQRATWSQGRNRKVFIHQVPPCAGIQSLDVLPGDDGKPLPLDQEANALYLRKMVAQLRPLHQQIIEGSRSFTVTTKADEADLFYIPAFFSVLFWIGDLEALRCAAMTVQQLAASPFFAKRQGYDHLLLHGVEFQHYRDQPGFALTDYHPLAANWIVLTVACPRPCGSTKDSHGLRSRFVLLPHASRLRCHRGVAPRLTHPRRFRIGYVGAIGPKFDERQAFFNVTCDTQRWLQTEDGQWHQSAPWTAKHWALDGNSTILDAFLLSRRGYETCQASEGDKPWNFWWVQEVWRWRLVPEAEAPDWGSYFRKAFSIPFYGFSDGSLGEKLERLYGAQKDVQDIPEFQAERREQPIFNSLLFETIYSHSEVCLVLRGDTADGTKRLWDAMTRGCLPAFASTSDYWPMLPFPDKVPWADFSFFFYGVNSTFAAARVLAALQHVPQRLLRRKRQHLIHWLPSLVTTVDCANRSGPDRRSALELAMEEAFQRSSEYQLANGQTKSCRTVRREGDPNHVEVPNLMWLLAEDCATQDSHMRACDRNFVVLKVKRLLLNMEKVFSFFFGIESSVSTLESWHSCGTRQNRQYPPTCRFLSAQVGEAGSSHFRPCVDLWGRQLPFSHMFFW
eukprot:s583_g14.t2